MIKLDEPDFLAILEQKNITRMELSERWNISERQILNISSNPKTRDYDALKGLPDYSFDLNEYSELIVFCLRSDNWNLENLAESFNKMLKNNHDIDIGESGFFDRVLAFKLLEKLCFQIIKEHFDSFDLFVRFRNKIEISTHSHDARMLAYVHFINEYFFDSFNDYDYQLVAKK